MKDGSKIGTISISDGLGQGFGILVDVTGDLTDVPGDDSVLTLIKKVHVTACCAGPSSCLEKPYDIYPAVKTVTVQAEEPVCTGLQDQRVAITVNAELTKGGMNSFNAIFNPPPLVTFKVRTGDGTGTTANPYTEASYFDAQFTGSTHTELNGKWFDGYCIDVDNHISPGTNYQAYVYSFIDFMHRSPTSDNTPGVDGVAYDPSQWTGRIPNVDKPWNLDAVAYCINHWFVGTTYSPPVGGTVAAGTKLTDTTMQRAIWNIVDDDQQYNPGSGTNVDMAKYISDDCLAKGEGFVPSCSAAPPQRVPVVVVPHGTASNFQNQYVQTTFAALGLPCHVGQARAEAQALCDPDGRNGASTTSVATTTGATTTGATTTGATTAGSTTTGATTTASGSTTGPPPGTFGDRKYRF